jgi:hypothetical protein
MQRGAHVGADLRAQTGVQRAERLVEQHHGGLRSQCPGHGHSLLLAAGQLGGHPAAEPGQPDQFEQLGHPVASPHRPGQPETDVAGHGEVREQRTLLRHHTDPPALRRNVDTRAGHPSPAEQDLPLGGRVKAGEHPKQRGLAAARRAEHGGQRPGRHVQVQVIEHHLLAVAGRQVAYLQRGHRRITRSSTIAGTAATSTSSAANGAASA